MKTYAIRFAILWTLCGLPCLIMIFVNAPKLFWLWATIATLGPYFIWVVGSAVIDMLTNGSSVIYWTLKDTVKDIADLWKNA